MKKQHILGVAVIVLVFGGVASAFYRSAALPQTEHFALTEGESLSVIPSIIDDAGRAKVIEQIELIPTYPDIEEYQKSLAIAQNYMFLGEGKQAYKVLIAAIELKPEKPQAFSMLGNLLVSAGALRSARTAYETAVLKASYDYVNHAALTAFLQQYFPEDKEAIAAAYKEGLAKTGDHQNLLKDNAAWLEEIGDIAGAIALWQKVYENGGYDKAVRDRINALRAQQ